MERSAFRLFSLWWHKNIKNSVKTNEDIAKHAGFFYKNLHFSEYLILWINPKMKYTKIFNERISMNLEYNVNTFEFEFFFGLV